MSVPDTFRAYEFASFGNPFTEIRLNENTHHRPLETNQVRIKVVSTSLNIVDSGLAETPRLVQAFVHKMPSPEQPLRLGFDCAGIIVGVGSDVTSYNIGDEVFALASFTNLGTFAEYANIDANYVVPKPANMSFNEAAGLPLAGGTVYQAIVELGKIQVGDRVLILGGSAATGAIGIQLAKALGASHVTATCSGRNIELVRSFGADEVIDYTTTDWKTVIAPHTIDLLVDCGMEPNSWNSGAQQVLKRDTGRFVTAGIPSEKPIASEFGATHAAFISSPHHSYLHKLGELAEAGLIKVPIDSVHAFKDLVAAFKIVVSKRARGKVVIEVVEKNSV